MKKLKLNKTAIAHLTNPDRAFGGEGANGYQSDKGDVTCQTCDVTCVTCAGQATCDPLQTCYVQTASFPICNQCA